jgi:hypothetical protein
MATFVLELDAWDAACPVLLPLGPVTVAPIVPASAGVLVPFILFCFALLFHLLNNMFLPNFMDAINEPKSRPSVWPHWKKPHATSRFKTGGMRWPTREV